MTNKYAIYCDSLEDEQLLKDWIKKESDLEGYNDYNYRKLYFHFPANDYLGFQQNFHLYDVCLAKDGYIKINIKDFLKEYYMKELTELPKSWAVKCDGSQLFKDTVIKYLDNNSGGHFKGHKDAYYGITFRGKVDCYYHGIDQYFDTILTLDQFIKLTTKNMKTQLLGLPVIKGEYYHLEAFKKDVEKLGYTFVIGQTPFATISHDNIGLEQVLSSHRNFTTLFLGTTSFQKNDTKEFQLPQDWKIALDFMKENMDRWLKIQKESKEPEFKVGDIVVCLDTQNTLVGTKDTVYNVIEHKLNNKNFVYIGEHSCISTKRLRLATPQEIEEYNNKPKIFKMTSTSGNFELEVSKKGVYYRPEDKYLNVNDIDSIRYPLVPNICYSNGRMGHYPTQITKVDVGCKKDTLVSEWKQVYDYYKSITQ